MHITSLPGKFGIGDLGESALNFADFLFRSKQTVWQLLPLNPTAGSAGHSPYSSISSMAGNALLISPEMLVDSDWLTIGEINENTCTPSSRVNFEAVEKIKHRLFEKAFDRFSKSKKTKQRQQFDEFCQKEKSWLHNFALYSMLKSHHENMPWYKWPKEYKFRDAKSLTKFSKDQLPGLEKIKWLQYVFFQQWHMLKMRCNDMGIRILGDLPFYVSYDSADVWASPEIFSLDRQGNPKEIAGVPPDYFNAEGQCWGMPVFNWNALKKQQYAWWVNRIKKNIELFDLIRLDHFRAFADYWAVPADEKTAINGQWRKGPGAKIFQTLKTRLGRLPFLAEDLGDINEAVHRLRRDLHFPGMKVLQFAFGDNMSTSDYIPHNYESHYAVYTGTHDNNTTRGWFRKDATSTERDNIQHYTGEKVTEKNIHQKLIQLAYSSVAATAIVPLQDVLGLDESARMNVPASTKNNWSWRLLPDQLNDKHEVWLRNLTMTFNRVKT